MSDELNVKTDWNENDRVMPVDVNRIEGNIKTLALTQDNMAQQISSDNMLDNWDFRTPPVNQRGKDEYTGAAYSIDMWRSGTAGSRTTLQNGYIKVERTIPGTISSSLFKQIIEFPEKYKGKIVTLSAIIRNNNIAGAYFYIPAAVGIKTVVIPVTNEFVLFSQTFTLADTFDELAAILSTPTIVGDIDIQAMKLELGSISTLVNDLPMNYGATLAKCQRRQFLCTSVSVRQSTENLPNVIYFDIPVPVTMRVNPTATLLSYLEGSSILVVRDMSGTDHTGFTFAYTALGATIQVAAQKQNHGLTDAVLVLRNVLFDANM